MTAPVTRFTKAAHEATADSLTYHCRCDHAGECLFCRAEKMLRQAAAEGQAVATLIADVKAARQAELDEQARHFPGVRVVHAGRWGKETNALMDAIDRLTAAPPTEGQ